MATFHGQVKKTGIDNWNWKSGSVSFQSDHRCQEWKAFLRLDANPGRSAVTMELNSCDLSVKCGRLMIENKKGSGGIHLKLRSDKERKDALELVSRIKQSLATVKKSPSNSMSNPIKIDSGPENTSPRQHQNNMFITPSPGQANGYSSQNSLSTSLTRKRPPDPQSPQPKLSSSKRRLELPLSGDTKRVSFGGLDSDSQQESKFTGMKDYSQRNGRNTNNMSTKSFYGATSSQTPFLHNGSSQFSPYSSSKGLNSSGSGKLSLLKGLHGKNTSHNDMEPLRKTEDNSNGDTAEGTSGGSLNGSYGGEENWSSDHRGTVGLANLGNTCFMNSPLQCLSSMEPFSLDVQSAMVLDGQFFKKDSVTRTLYQLMKNIRSSNSNSMRLREILKQIRECINGKFEQNTQQDAHEFLTELLDRTDEEVKSAMRLRQEDEEKVEGKDEIDGQSSTVMSSRNGSNSSTSSSPSPTVGQQTPSPVESNFKWHYRESSQCKLCNTRTPYRKSDDTILILPIILPTDIEEKLNVQDCVDQYFANSELERECTKCGKSEKAISTRQIVQRPRIFILMLLRYQHTDNLQQKMTNNIELPRYISIDDFCADDAKPPHHVQPVFMLDRETTDLSPVSVQPKEKRLDNKTLSAVKGNDVNVNGSMPKSALFSMPKSRFEAPKSTSTPTSKGGVCTTVHYRKALKRILYSLRKMNRLYHDSQDPNVNEDMTGWYAGINYIATKYLTYYNDVCSALNQKEKHQIDPPDCKLPDWVILSKVDSIRDGLEDCYSKEISAAMSFMLLSDVMKVEEISADKIDTVMLNALVEDIRERHLERLDEHLLHWKDVLVIELAQVMALKHPELCKYFPLDPDDKADVSMSGQEEMPALESMSHDTGIDMDEEEAAVQMVLNNEYMNNNNHINGELPTDLQDLETSSGSGLLGPGPPLSVDTSYEPNSHDPLHLGKSMDMYSEGELANVNCNILDEEAQFVYVMALSKFETHGKSMFGQPEAESNTANVNTSTENNKDEDESPCFALGDTDMDFGDEDDFGSDDIVTSAVMSQIGETNSSVKSSEAISCSLDLSTGNRSGISNSGFGVNSNLTDSERLGISESGDSRKLHEVDNEVSFLIDQSLDVINSNSCSKYSETTTSCDPVLSESKSESKSCQDTSCVSCLDVDQEADMSGRCESLDAEHGSPVLQDKLKNSVLQEQVNLVNGVDKTCNHSTSTKDSSLKDEQMNIGNIIENMPSSNKNHEKLSLHKQKLQGKHEEKYYPITPPETSPNDSNAIKTRSKNSGHCGDKSLPSIVISAPVDEKLSLSPPKSSPGTTSDSGSRKSSPNLSSKVSPVTDTKSEIISCNVKDLPLTSQSVKTDVVVPISPVSKKDQYLVSPSKTNNFVKSKDYSRLRSPKMSPRKRPKGPHTPQSAKKLLPEFDKMAKRNTLNGSSSHLGNTPKSTTNESVSGLSIDVNVDDMSFFNRRDEIFSPCPINAPSSSPVQNASLSHKISFVPPSPKFPVNGELPKEILTSTPQPGSSNTGSESSRICSVLSIDTTHGNVMTDKNGVQPVSNLKSKATRSLAEAFGSPVEKENKTSSTSTTPTQQEKSNARQKRLDHIQTGKAPSSYRLMGVVNHLGDSINTGHYISYCYNMQKGRWFYLDDKHTNETTETQVRNASVTNGYVFFYMDKNVFEKFENQASSGDNRRKNSHRNSQS